ncbi:MAG: ribonuclease PH [Planctomycetota bacterium]
MSKSKSVRKDGRKVSELRPVKFTRGYTRNAAGSVLIETGQTMVLCTASWEENVPAWKKDKGGGWLTAEYDMLPGSTGRRRARDRGKVDGRTQEIQRLVGRSLRSVVDLTKLGERTLYIDCDVLQADGGTRTASITGAYIALCDAVQVAMSEKRIATSPIQEAVAAVSVGIVEGRALLDLCYEEDVEAEVDMNVVMTSSGQFVEVQGTGESATFTRSELDRMLKLAGGGIAELLNIQRLSLKRRRRP